MNEDIIKDIRRVFSSLAVIAPFSYPILMMPIEIRNDLNNWAGTNGTVFYCNPEKWKTLSFKQKMFVAMHEWIHIVMQHSKRMQGRKRKIWNAAACFTANDIIVSDLRDRFVAPKGVLYDIAFKDKTVEQVYNILIEKTEQEKQKGQKQELDSNNQVISAGEAAQQLVNDDNCSLDNDLFPMPSTVDDQKLIDAIIKAAIRAKGMKKGRLPGRYEEFIESLKKSTIPWERLLFRFAKKSLKGTTDRNPYKPDPKYLPFDILIPTEQSNKIAKLVFIVDTSASMLKEEFEYVCGHIQRLGTLVDKCIVITADTKVREIVRVKRIKKELKDKKLMFKGRGGTDMTEAFKEAEKLKPDLIILYSDMMIASSVDRWPAKPKRSQVIFLATENSPINDSPYGIFVKVKNTNAK